MSDYSVRGVECDCAMPCMSVDLDEVAGATDPSAVPVDQFVAVLGPSPDGDSKERLKASRPCLVAYSEEKDVVHTEGDTDPAWIIDVLDRDGWHEVESAEKLHPLEPQERGPLSAVHKTFFYRIHGSPQSYSHPGLDVC